MLALLLFASIASSPADGNSDAQALAQCKPELARKVSGDISEFSVGASANPDGWTIIRGPMTALIGMGEPGPGQASTHHLIRAQFNYICWVHDGRVKKLETTRIQ